MAFKFQVDNTPEEFKAIEAAIRAVVGEQLEKHAYIAMEVLSHVPAIHEHEAYVARSVIKRTLEINVKVDITEVPLTIKMNK